MATDEEISIERIRGLFDYNPFTGVVTRRKYLASNAQVGAIVGSINSDGYLARDVDERSIKVHRLCWAHYYGAWPDGQVDYRNSIRTDNCIANLREATNQQNQFNRGATKRNKHGLRGVQFRDSRWVARIRAGGKQIHLGSFKTKEEASAAYETRAIELHGEFYAQQ